MLQHSIKKSLFFTAIVAQTWRYSLNQLEGGRLRTLIKAVLAQKTLSLFREIADDNRGGRGHSSMLQHRSLGTFHNSNCILIEKYWYSTENEWMSEDKGFIVRRWLKIWDEFEIFLQFLVFKIY